MLSSPLQHWSFLNSSEFMQTEPQEIGQHAVRAQQQMTERESTLSGFDMFLFNYPLQMPPWHSFQRTQNIIY